MKSDNHRKPLDDVKNRGCVSHSQHSPVSATMPLVPLMLYFRALGRMPFTREKSGYLSSRYSWATMYSLVILSTQIVTAVYSLHSSVLAKSLLRDFDSFVFSIVGLLYISFIFNGVVNWTETPAVLKAVNRWRRLQNLFDFVVKKPISSPLLDHTMLAASVVMFFSIFLIYLPSVISTREKDSIVLFIYFFIVQYMILLDLFWLVLINLVSRTAVLLKENLVDVISMNGSAEQIRGNRDVWLELNGFTCCMSNGLENTMSSWVTKKYILFVLGLYAAAIHCITTGSILSIPGFLYMPIITMYSFVRICDDCYHADLKIGRDFQKAIFMCGLQRLSASAFCEVEMFLCCLESASTRFILRGTIEFRRSTIIQMIHTSITYLVVLVQFKHAI